MGFMYTFAPYFPKEKIYKVIGFEDNRIIQTSSENMNQLIFIKDKNLVCNIYGFSNNIGYYFSFEQYFGKYYDNDKEFLIINASDNAIFTAEKKYNEIILTYNIN